MPDLNTVKAIQKIAWAASSCSLHLVHASIEDIHKAHEKVSAPCPAVRCSFVFVLGVGVGRVIKKVLFGLYLHLNLNYAILGYFTKNILFLFKNILLTGESGGGGMPKMLEQSKK